jgi:DNA modification methylase
MSRNRNLNLTADRATVEKYEFEPIQGYPMLNWQGKRTFTSTQYYPAQLKEVYGPEIGGWRNKIYWGDNLQVMSNLLKYYRGKVNLIYIDPPYDSKADYKMKIQLRGRKVTNDLSVFEEKQYTDIWTNDEYLQFLYERLIIMRELLTDDGSLYLHCDWHKGHYLRCILDEVFSPQSFRNEIVWYYFNKMQGNVNRFASNHDVLYFYSKSPNFTFNRIRERRDKPVQQIKRVWDKESQSLVNARDEQGNIIYITATHKTIDDVWRLPMLQPADQTELVDYPTQKPEALTERVIRASTNPGDLVFDSFMGSGTTQAVALKLGRRFIGADMNLGAIQIAKTRLIGIAEEVGDGKSYVPGIKNGLDDYTKTSLFESDEEEEGGGVRIDRWYTGFEFYNVNNYDVFRNPVQAKELLIEALEIQPLASASAGVYDGEKDGRMVKIMPINRIATRADLNELIAGFDYKTFERRQAESPNRPVEKLLLVCMGHEPDLAAHLKAELHPFKIDVEVVDVLRDESRLEFKRPSEALLAVKKGSLVIERFYPMNLLQKLSLMKEDVKDWRELVESVLVDWNYDGAVLTPSVVDVPGNGDMVSGSYSIPKEAGTIRVKITDLLSESWEGEIQHG